MRPKNAYEAARVTDYKDLTITEEGLIAALKAALDSKGEHYVYPRQGDPEGDAHEAPLPGLHPWGSRCLYVHQEAEDEVPGCIVGQVLHHLGVSLEDLKKVEGDNALAVLRRLRVNSGGYGSLLVEIQRRQDDGLSWGESIRGGAQMATHSPDNLLAALDLQ